MHWVVGDLQGCADAFERLLKKVRFDPARDELWCAGDLLNRGPQSLEALRLWRDVGGNAVLGNHEMYALSMRDGAWPRKNDTLDELLEAHDADELFGRLAAQPLMQRIEAPDAAIPEAYIVHAGLHPAWSNLKAVAKKLNSGERDQAWRERPEAKIATRIRCCDPQGKMSKHSGAPDESEAPFEAWDRLRSPGPWVVHGHWAWRGHYRNDEAKVIGLDSGCVYGGPLTAWCLEEDRIEQVEATN